MKTPLLTVENLTKCYQTQIAVDNISLNIYKGEICGLVGENGAGKTTLLRILSGLIKPTSGNVSYSRGNRIGALIESPSLHPNLSAIDNLHYVSLQLNLKQSKSDLFQILKLVGLESVSPRKKAKDFSLGMRQRLAIALAILDKPDFLILDEPINGLDPVGIKEMRQIILNLRENCDMTILISSHILSELELVVDRYIIMHQGKIITELSKDSLYQKFQAQLYLQTTNNLATEKLLEVEGLNYERLEDYFILPITTNPMDIIKLLIKHEIDLVEMFKNKQSFENYYLTLINKGAKYD